MCNRAKSDKDDRDVRNDIWPDVDPDCLFCEALNESRIVEEFDSVVAIKDEYPVSEGHLLVLPRRHTPDYFTMTSQERRDAEDLGENSPKQNRSRGQVGHWIQRWDELWGVSGSDYLACPHPSDPQARW